MSRLPTPGGDDGAWGDVLNDFLKVEHNDDGTLKNSRLRTKSFGITLDGGGAVIQTGVKGYLTVPYDCTITAWTLFADQSGSIVIDLWKDTYANFPPTIADTITGGNKPTLSSAQKNKSSSLSGWTVTATAGDVIGFNVDSVTTVTRVTLQLTATI